MGRFPPHLLAFLILCLVLIVIFLAEPPHTPCDAQVEVFKTSQKRFLYEKNKSQSFSSTLSFCENNKTPGSCLEFFSGMRRLLADLHAPGSECEAVLLEEEVVKKSLLEAFEAITLLAWESKTQLTGRKSWLDEVHLQVYCDLKNNLKKKMNWSSLAHGIMSRMPNTNGMATQDIWSSSILSEPCSN